ncbi:hypothetical protein BR93DRAFT_998788 [Coniochaeta sp. PMI_546]|nr:hypothetical protein BR93DRAFT_998788 [Coniochaeta sp. PMI_546]
MFGRRRRPILGAAVLVGASRSAARHEVQHQAVMQSQREIEIQREVDMRRREDEEQERRTQRAVDEAVKAAVTESQASQQSATVNVAQPPQQVYIAQPPNPNLMQETGVTMTTPRQAYTSSGNSALSFQPEQAMRAPAPHLPVYASGSPSLDERPKSAQGLVSTGPSLVPKSRYCSQCGSACQNGDIFCRYCGAKQVYQERKVE